MLSKNIVKYIQSLHQKKFRDEHKVFIAEGPKVINELLLSEKFVCDVIYGTELWINKNKSILNEKNIKAEAITDAELQTIGLQKTPNKVLGIFQKKEAEIFSLKENVCIMLDDIQDPGNLGTIIRTADWFGIKNIICSLYSADCYNPKVIQSTMGSFGKLNILYTDLKYFIENNDAIVYATTLHGENIFDKDKITEGILLFGNESQGIKDDLLQLSAEKITIPKRGEAESLNIAVAAGIILSHLI